MLVSIIGLGLIGGSLAMDLRANGFASYIMGLDHNAGHQDKAMDLGLVDEICDLETICKNAELVVLAIPVNALVKQLPGVLDLIGKETVVTDMGSTKLKIIEAIAQHPMRGRYVPAHPMAGTEYSGPMAAINNLFQGKAAIICNKESCDGDALLMVERLFKSLFMRLLYMDAKDHDMHAAYVSHISHISSFALALTVLEKEKNETNIFNMAGGGFASTVRLAKSSPEMWRDVYEQNSEHLLDVIDSYIEKVLEFRDHIAQGNFEATFQMMQEANRIRKVLEEKRLVIN